VNPTQISLPVEVRPEEIIRKQTLGAAIELCAELGGHALDKTLQQGLEVDKAQFSRWQSGTEGIIWPKFVRLMDLCGNDAPLLWMLHQRGYDLASLRKRETETERKLREAMEEIESLRNERDVTMRVLREIKAAA
jgi:plasmid maintenance system antidote protein VapI